MSDISITPTIEVRIGRQTRVYHAFITTAPPALDAPSTLTLYAGSLRELEGLADEIYPITARRADTATRIVLVDATELGWQRARCRSHAHRLTPVDPVLVGHDALQQWLWQRLQVPDAVVHG